MDCDLETIYAAPHHGLTIDQVSNERIKISAWLAKCADPDGMPPCAASNQGLHCLLRPICPNRINMIMSLVLNTFRATKFIKEKL